MKSIGGPHELAALVRQLEKERREAQPVIESLKSTVADWWDREIPDEWRTAGFVEQLTLAASGMIESDPATAISLAHYAITVASAIDRDAYPDSLLASIEAGAWKKLGNAHRYRSAFDAALRALDAADRRLATAPALRHDAAGVMLARALVFADMRRDEEAKALLARSMDIYLAHGDDGRVAQCLAVGAMVEHRALHLDAARELYENALAIHRTTGDLHGIAGVLNNLGLVRDALGDRAEAVAAFHEALAILDDLGMSADVLRVRWVLSGVLLRDGQHQRAHDLLVTVRGAFLRLGMHQEAGLVGLELAEAQLALGRPERAILTAEDVAEELLAAHLNDDAARAIAYLREAMSTARARDAVRHVRRFFEELQHEPARLFLPPAE